MQFVAHEEVFEWYENKKNPRWDFRESADKIGFCSFARILGAKSAWSNYGFMPQLVMGECDLVEIIAE